ncbi:Uncharacterised protein [BD1-7 clade bacterium]|uniref:Uncharacterized protein n=1 Tax=BD1-7 clade bacterium TaxID=2029982 RepID=A0A5S9N2L8_9GAMM|nr:Uncharacterised protein [BD1-7 clade bacterium]CAA0116016.1 Uncharacterised protein [BD1-7 clade bacterium]
MAHQWRVNTIAAVNADYFAKGGNSLKNRRSQCELTIIKSADHFLEWGIQWLVIRISNS